MPKLIFDITTSLDGYVAGPDPSLDEPLGKGGEQLHEWAFATASWHRQHGRQAGEAGQDSDVIDEGIERTGAYVMGRGMFGGGPGPWGDEPWEGWWGEEPPYHTPVFVLTNYDREPLEMKGGTTFNFVSDGIESALEQARAAVGEKDILLAGGANVIQQYLKAGLVDEFQVHLAPLFLGGGVRLFDGAGLEEIEIEQTRVLVSPKVTHLRYRVAK